MRSSASVDVLFLRRRAAFLRALCLALAEVVEDLQLLCPWEAWEAAGAEEVAWCRVPSSCRRILLSCSFAGDLYTEFRGPAACADCLAGAEGVVVEERASLRFQRHAKCMNERQPPRKTRHCDLTATSPNNPHAMQPGTLPFRARFRTPCQLCHRLFLLPAPRRAFVAPSANFGSAFATRRPAARHHGRAPRVLARRVTTTPRPQELVPGATKSPDWSRRIVTLKSRLADVQALIDHIKSSPKVEPEAATLEALDGLETIARQAIAIRAGQRGPPKVTVKQSSADAILAMGRDEANEENVAEQTAKPPSLSELPTPPYLSQIAVDLLKHPNVFISPHVLAAFIELQRLLACPRTIPEILYLYANKPVPELNSSPPKYYKPSPKSAKQAIPYEIAHEALTAAIEAKDMPLALAVVDTVYRAPAWKRRRMLSKLGIPGAFVAMAPLAVYMIAEQLSEFSNLMEPGLFKLYSFMGISTYLLCTGTLGYVALTTHNDHHERVVWRPGMPLTERYLREDERAALDRIACAWGFKELWRRGDEEGEDWEGLRKLCLLRGMILDKPELMPGMNPGNRV